MSTKQTELVHRMTFTESEITGLVSVLIHVQNSSGLEKPEIVALSKLKKKQFEFSEGIATPAYQVTGRASVTKSISLESIGATKEESIAALVSSDVRQEAEFMAADHNADIRNEKNLKTWMDYIPQAKLALGIAEVHTAKIEQGKQAGKLEADILENIETVPYKDEFGNLLDAGPTDADLGSLFSGKSGNQT